MNRILYRLDHLIFDEYRMDPKAMGAYRIVFSVLIIFVLGIPDFRFLGQYPDLLFQPPAFSYAQLLEGFPPAYVFVILSSLLVVFHFLVLFGLFTRFSSVALSILYLILYTFKFSFGKIDHSWIVTLWIPLLMGIAGWGSEYSMDSALRNRKYRLHGWPVFILASILVFGMFSAGLPKLMSDWLSLDTQAVRARFISDYFISERQDLLAPLFLKIEFLPIWEFFDYVGVFFELGFIFVLFRKRFLSWYIVIAIFFHIMNLLMMNIDFSGNLPIYLMFIPFVHLFEKIPNVTMSSSKWRLALIGSFGVYFFVWYFNVFPVSIFTVLVSLGVNPLVISLIIWVFVFVCYLYAIVKKAMSDRPRSEMEAVKVNNI